MPNGITNKIVSVEFFEIGYCTQLAALSLQGKPWKKVKFPALVTLIIHQDHGPILFDLGYSSNFFECSKRFPYNLYKLITPITYHEHHHLELQLKKHGCTNKDVKHVILSHFHADHIAGLEHFLHAKIYVSQEGYNCYIKKTGLSALMHGFIPGLVPVNTQFTFVENQQVIPLTNAIQPFTHGYELFNDGSLIAISLPGHARGQIGLLINQQSRPIFLVADAVWSSESYQHNIQPHILTYLLHDSRDSYRQTLAKLHLLHKNNQELLIVPSHCQALINSLTRSQHV